MRLPRAATRTASPAIPAAGFGLLQDNDIDVGVRESGGVGGGEVFGRLPMVGIGRNQEINTATSEVRLRGEKGETAEEGVVIGGGSGEDVARVGVEDLAGEERRRESLDMTVKMNHSD